MIYLNSFPLTEGKKHYLTFSVSHQDEGSWDLTVDINWKETIKETISSETITNWWKEYNIDVCEFAGSGLSFDLKQYFNGNKKSMAYWHNVKLTEE